MLGYCCRKKNQEEEKKSEVLLKYDPNRNSRMKRWLRLLCVFVSRHQKENEKKFIATLCCCTHNGYSFNPFNSSYFDCFGICMKFCRNVYLCVSWFEWIQRMKRQMLNIVAAVVKRCLTRIVAHMQPGHIQWWIKIDINLLVCISSTHQCHELSMVCLNLPMKDI